MWSQHKFLGISIGLHIITTVMSYNHGYVPQSCDSMLPEHKDRNTGRNYSPQNGTAPFDVTYSAVKLGEIIVTLKSTTIPFKGFLMEARESETGPAVGTFTLLTPAMSQTLDCNGQNSAVSHSNNHEKTSIQAKWTGHGTAPTIYLRVTFVENFARFWEPMSILINITTPAPSTVPVITSSTPTSQIPTTSLNTTSAAVSDLPASSRPVSSEVTTPASSTSHPQETTTSAPTSPPLIPLLQCQKVQLGTAFMIGNIPHYPLNWLGTVFRVNSNPHIPLKWVLKTLWRILSLAVETIALILFCLWDSSNVTLISLVCVVMFPSLVELYIVLLPIGPSHELKGIGDCAVKVVSFIHEMFTIAAIFVGLSEIEDCVLWKRGSTSPWLLKVMGAYTAWRLLFIILYFISYIYNEMPLKQSKIGSSKLDKKSKDVSRKMMLSTITKINIIIFYLGNIAFAVALIVGIFL